jgi:hypothetical protein
MVAKVYTDKLNLTKEQKSQIQQIYAMDNVQDLTYFPDNESEQISTAAVLAANQLDFDVCESLESRWSIKWWVKSGAGKAADCRVLYQW